MSSDRGWKELFPPPQMGLDHFVLVFEDCPDHLIDEVVGQIGVRHSEVVEANCLIVPQQ